MVSPTNARVTVKVFVVGSEARNGEDEVVSFARLVDRQQTCKHRVERRS
jgi:hypothetical protein